MQGCVAFLPFARVSLKSLIKKLYDFEPTTLGEHIRKRRLILGFTQREVAIRLGVVSWTILNWEKGYTKPPIESIPAIIQFLSYYPFQQPKTLPEHLLAKRLEMGWSLKKAAETLSVDPATWRNWERGKLILCRHHRTLVARFLNLSTKTLDQEMTSRWNRLHELGL